jgi:membrane-bound lytic murein transglycosylase D
MKRFRKFSTMMARSLKYTLVFVGIAAILIVVFSSKTVTTESEANNTNISGIQIPENLSFAGEKVPLHYFDVKESLERELLVNTYWHSQTLLLIKRSKRFFGHIEPILKKNNIPDDFKFLALAESGFANVISSAGAVGFWQFMPGTGNQYGLEINKEVDERYNLDKATEAACSYLTDLYRRYGNWTMAAAAYNSGPGSLNKQVQRQYSSNYYDLLLNEETARYIFRILALKLVISSPANYGFVLTESDLYQPIPYKEIIISEPVKDLALLAFQHGTNYKILKILNPWLRENFLTNAEKKKYIIKIPANGYRDHSRELSKSEADSIGSITDSTIR